MLASPQVPAQHAAATETHLYLVAFLPLVVVVVEPETTPRLIGTDVMAVPEAVAAVMLALREQEHQDRAAMARLQRRCHMEVLVAVVHQR